MPRRQRNKLLIGVIGLGLLNFLAYTIIYAILGGDAKNGWIVDGQCFVRGHFLRLGSEGQAVQVTMAVWIYSYLHSISIWPTIGAVLCCMLTLARPHIIGRIPKRAYASASSTFEGMIAGKRR